MNQSIKKMYKKAFSTREISTEEWFEFIEDKDRNEVHEVINTMIKVEDRLRKFKDGYHHTTKIRKYVNHIMWSDIEPFEVVRIITPKCVEIRPMQTKQTVFPKEIYVGGFSAHTADNYNQQYEYTSDETASTMRIRKCKTGWKAGSMKFRMSDTPRKHYDYNF